MAGKCTRKEVKKFLCIHIGRCSYDFCMCSRNSRDKELTTLLTHNFELGVSRKDCLWDLITEPGKKASVLPGLTSSMH